MKNGVNSKYQSLINAKYLKTKNMKLIVYTIKHDETVFR